MKHDSLMGIIIQALRNKNYTNKQIEEIIIEKQKIEEEINEKKAASIYYDFSINETKKED